MSFAPIVKKVSPAVVSINAIQEHPQSSAINPLFDDDFLSFFFGIPKENLRGNHPNNLRRIPQALATSVGSGVIISDKGFVITCAHVIHGATKIKIKLTDNREFDAKIAILDKKNDLALLKLEDGHSTTTPLPFISLEQNGNLEVGDIVLALGNPFSVGQSVTNGIVSALARSINGRVLIQTDASINPGNSGGALVDLDGDLVAIPNAIVSKTGGSHGIGFAIPISVVKPLLKAALSGKQVEHPWDGLSIETLTPDRAESLALKISQGAFITKIHEESPAAKKGVKASDIITEVNGLGISTAEDYIMKLQDINIGEEVTLKINSKNDIKEITFILESPPRIPAPDETILEGKNILSGLKVANLSPALAIENGLDMNKRGVIILDIMGGKNANGLQFGSPVGIMKGDIISNLNGTPVTLVSDLKEGLKDPFKKIIIQRGKNTLQIQTQ